MPMTQNRSFLATMLFSALAGMLLNVGLNNGAVGQPFEIAKAFFETDYERDERELERLAESNDFAFKDLYAYLYENVRDVPSAAAINELSKQLPYSKNELEDILLSGNTRPILEYREQRSTDAQDPQLVADSVARQVEYDANFEAFLSSNNFSSEVEAALIYESNNGLRPVVLSSADIRGQITQEMLLQEYSTISNLYEDELEFQRSNGLLAYQALASEMFMNGDLSDSGNVDLLYDLDLIHFLIFGEFIEYPDRSSEVNLASEFLWADYVDPLAALDLSVQLAAEEGGVIEEALVCDADTELGAALEDYANRVQEETSSGGGVNPNLDFDPSLGLGGLGSGLGSGSGSSGGSGGGSAGGVSSGDLDLDEYAAGFALQPALWERTLPCNDIFCITVNLVTDSAESSAATDFGETENCIACHVSYINERMQETLSKSLVANKVPMNWFEDATCKEAGLNLGLGMNFYAIKQPITLDPGDDIDSNPQVNQEALRAELQALSDFPSGTGEDDYSTTRAELECQSLINLRELSGLEQSLFDTIDECSAVAARIDASVEDAYEAFTFEGNVQDMGDLYTQIAGELYTMLLYFNGFREGLQATYLSEQAPLSSLINKEYCEWYKK